MQISSVVEIEQSFDLTLQATIHESPVWRYRLWVPLYEKKLPFMADYDNNYTRAPVFVNSIITDYEPMSKAKTYSECYDKEFSFFVDGAELFVHFGKHNPPWAYTSIRNGVLYGFTDREPMRIGNIEFLPEILDVPVIEDSADPYTYGKMKLLSGNIVLKNTRGQFDQMSGVFGNDINIFITDESKNLQLLKKYYIANYRIDLQKATFEAKDRRERLSVKIPNELYTREAYPFIEDSYLDKPMQDAYGLCFGVLGTCLNADQLYEQLPELDVKEDWYTFRFARVITSGTVERIEVEMSEKWTEIYPKFIDQSTGKPITNPNPVKFNYTNGTIQIHYLQALKDGKKGSNQRPNKVRMTAVFNPQKNPGDIIKNLFEKYTDIKFSVNGFNIAEWESELRSLPDIGICLNTQKMLYEWIEKIQNGSLFGFQVTQYRDLITARVDSPNRAETFEISSVEILYPEEIAVDFDGEQYATYTNIKHSHEHSENAYKSVVNRSYWDKIMEIHRVDKLYEEESLLTGSWVSQNGETLTVEEVAALKGETILEDYSEIRPILRGIKLSGLKWFDLRVYDTGFIEFSVNNLSLRNFSIIRNVIKRRKFVGRLRVQILKVKADPRTGIVELDVRQRDPVWSFPYSGIFNIDNRDAKFTDFEAEYDNLSAGSVEGDFDFIVDGGSVNGLK